MDDIAPIFISCGVGHAGPIKAFARVPGIRRQPCVIAHYTRDGAFVCSPIELPDCFILRSQESRIERLCHVKWRTEEIIGVEFVNARSMGRAPVRATNLLQRNKNVIALFCR
jgi:hypothetical protein